MSQEISRYLWDSGNDRETYLRGGPVFRRWAEQHRSAVASDVGSPYELTNPIWMVVFCPVMPTVVDQIERIARLQDSVVLVDVHHPIWRPDLQQYPGEDPHAGKEFWNNPKAIEQIERALEVCDGIITPRMVWRGGQDEPDGYPMGLALAEYNTLFVIEDLKDDADVPRYTSQLQEAFLAISARKEL